MRNCDQEGNRNRDGRFIPKRAKISDVEAHNVKPLDKILGFRIVGKAMTLDCGTITGVRTEMLALDDGPRPEWRIRAVQPASGRELLMYTLLLEMWEHQPDTGRNDSEQSTTADRV